MLYRLTIDAFPLTPAAEQALAALQDSRIFARSRISLKPGGLAGAIGHYHDNTTPQVVIVEDTGEPQAVLERLGQLAEVCIAGTRVMVIGPHNDIGLYRALLARGVSDYLVTPLAAGQISAAIEAIFADPQATPRGRMIAFMGARGGVGSSTLAHHTAWTLSQNPGDTVLALDLDLAFGTLGLAFNVDARQTVGEILGEPDRLDAQLLDRITVKYDDRLQLLPAPSALGMWPSIEVETIDKLFDLVRQMAPLVVVDLPHLWAPWVEHALETTDELVVIAQPDLANLRDVKNFFDGVGQRRGEKLPSHLVLNKVDAYKKTQLSGRDFADSLQVKPALAVPFDPIFGEAANNGQMVGEIAKTHKVAEAVRQLAQLVSGRNAAPLKRSGSDRVTSWLKRAGVVK